MTALVYILYSPSFDTFYTGFTTISVSERLERHNSKYYDNAYTSRASDWEVYVLIECVSEQQARLIETHIKRMKSKQYIENLKKYPDMIGRLLTRYSIR
jgi:putative endonuclease